MSLSAVAGLTHSVHINPEISKMTPLSKRDLPFMSGCLRLVLRTFPSLSLRSRRQSATKRRHHPFDTVPAAPWPQGAARSEDSTRRGRQTAPLDPEIQ